MVTLEIEVGDELIETVGAERLRKSVQHFVEQLELKFIAQELSDDMDRLSLEDNPVWQQARKAAWDEWQQSHESN